MRDDELRTDAGRPATLFLTRRAAEREVLGHITRKRLHGARTVIRQVARGFLKTDRGWEALVIPGGHKSAYLI